MRLSLRQLQIFLAICDHGSTVAAAGALALSQSATSAALKELEDLLDTRLFDRVGRRLLVNDDGRTLMPQARQMLDAASQIERQFARAASAGAAGLRIGASTTIGIYLLPALLAALPGAGGASGYPQVTIANTADIARSVANFNVDVGLIEGPCHEASLQVEPWTTDELIIVCSPRHALATSRSGEAIPVAALRRAGWLLREAGSGTREAVEHALVPHLHYLRAAGEFSNSEAIKHAAAAGLGIACLSRVIVAELMQTGSLVELKTVLPALRRHFYLITHQQKILSGGLANFIGVCRAYAQ